MVTKFLILSPPISKKSKHMKYLRFCSAVTDEDWQVAAAVLIYQNVSQFIKTVFEKIGY